MSESGRVKGSRKHSFYHNNPVAIVKARPAFVKASACFCSFPAGPAPQDRKCGLRNKFDVSKKSLYYMFL